MNDLFHQMFFSRVSSHVASRLQVKEQIKKGMNTWKQMWNDELWSYTSGLWQLGLKQIGVLLLQN